MFTKLFQKLHISQPVQDFFKSSSIVFFANIFNAILSYALIVIVSHRLDSLTEWTALNSIVLILGLVITGLSTDYVRKISEYDHQNHDYPFLYLQKVKKSIHTMFPPVSIVTILICVLCFPFLSKTGNVILISIFINFFLQIYALFHQDFLLGILSINHFIINIIFSSIVRFIVTIIFLLLQFDILALPIGLILGTLITYIYPFYIIHKKRFSITENKNITFSIRKEIKNISETVIATFLLYFFIYIPPVISSYIFSTKDADIFAVMVNYGQIIHLGAMSFFSLILAFGVRQKGIQLYLTSFFLTLIASIGVSALFYIFHTPLLQMLNRDEYTIFSYFIFLYLVYISFFNSIIISSRILIAKNSTRSLTYLLLLGIIVFVGILSFLVINNYLSLSNFIYFLLFLTSILSFVLFIKTIQQEKKKEFC